MMIEISSVFAFGSRGLLTKKGHRKLFGVMVLYLEYRLHAYMHFSTLIKLPI